MRDIRHSMFPSRSRAQYPGEVEEEKPETAYLLELKAEVERRRQMGISEDNRPKKKSGKRVYKVRAKK